MIEQKFQQEGMFQETDSKSLFPKIADLVFSPSPGIFVRDNVNVPNTFTCAMSCTLKQVK